MEACSCAGAACVLVDGDSRPPFTDEASCRQFLEEAECVVVRRCGGRSDVRCADDEFCDFSAERDCGFADGTGICTARPTSCEPEASKVCGCNGVTYGGRCEAQSAGTDVQHEGACR